jgi:hypothetical protein
LNIFKILNCYIATSLIVPRWRSSIDVTLISHVMNRRLSVLLMTSTRNPRLTKVRINPAKLLYKNHNPQMVKITRPKKLSNFKCENALHLYLSVQCLDGFSVLFCIPVSHPLWLRCLLFSRQIIFLSCSFFFFYFYHKSF